MKNKKKFLYILFSLMIIVFGAIFILDMTKKEETPEIYDPTPSEINIEDKDKVNTPVESSSLLLAPDVDLNAERQKYNNNDIIGRLEIPNLINVLVMKGTDNSFYLQHDITKKYDIRGTEFMDYRVNPLSKQVNIYGHNTRDVNIKVAFLKLEKFLDKDFFEKNQYIVFQHDGGKNIYKIKAMKEIYESNNEHMNVEYTGSKFIEHVNKMTTGDGLINSREVPINENSNILVLQTCSHHWNKALYIITAVKIN